jgi:hypothetical protein
MRPACLFEGVAQRLTIIVSENWTNNAGSVFMGGYRRWVAEERPFLIPQTFYYPLPIAKGARTIPKFSLPIEQAILRKIAGPPLGRYSNETSRPVVIHRIVRYFVKALNFVPMFVDARGRRGKSEDYKEFHFLAEESDHITAILNSTLFYWFWRSHCDGFHCGYDDVFSMPYNKIVKAEYRRSLVRLLADLMVHLQERSQERTIRTKPGQIRYQEFYPAQSKPIVDEIDRVLAQHYKFTQNELDFIINYDTKYRLGPDEEIDEA